MKFRIFAILSLIVLSLASVWYFSIDDESRIQQESDYGLMFPDLLDQLNDIRQIRISAYESAYSVELADGAWGVSEFDFYPTPARAVSNFLVGLAQLRKLEPKTSDPEKFETLDLMGAHVDGSPTIEVDLLAQNDRALARLHIGKRRQSVRNFQLTEFHIREPDSEQTWLAEGGLSIPAQAIDWLDKELVNLDERIERVTIESSDNEPVTVVRSSQDPENFLLENTPEGHKIRYRFRLNDIGELFRRLKFEHVTRVSDWSSRIKVNALTVDGLIITAMFGAGEHRNFLRLKAESTRNAAPAVAAEVEELNQKWAGWMFEVSEVRRQTAELTMLDLVEPNDGSAAAN